MWSYSTFAQQLTEIEGVITDESSGKALEYVNIYFEGSKEGTFSDEHGKFSLKASMPYRAVIFSIVGYDQRKIEITPGQKLVLSIKLKNQLVNLDEVVVLSGENPAWAIIREVVKNKKKHDKRSLQAYEYKSYNRIELDIDNISTKLKKRKMISDIWDEIDSTSLEKNKNGNAILPIFLSESISKYYVKNDPFARREDVLKTKVSGVAVEDGSMISQLVGTAYQNYNFYSNWMQFLDKEFISPIADSWKLYYDYEIIDTLYVGNHLCFEMDVFPNRVQEPAFEGKIWITANSYALKEADLHINKSTNLNFIEGIDLHQKLEQTKDGAWLPVMTSLTLDVSNLGKNSASVVAKIYITTSDWVTNDLKDSKYYVNEVILAEDFNMYGPDYWQNARPASLTTEQLKTYQVIDTLVEIPRIKSYVEVVKLITTGYWRFGKVDVGPYLYSYAYNSFEGNSFRIGAKTNEYFNRKITLKGYLGYGTKDEKWKYGFNGSYIISRKPWTELKIHSSFDVQQVGIDLDELIAENYIFYAATRWQTFRRPYYLSDNSISIQTEPTKGLSHEVTLRHKYFDPQYPFYYYENPGYPDSNLKSDISSSTIKYSIRWARDEMFLQDGNERLSLGTRRSPIIQFDYTYGFKDVLDSDFEFTKIQLKLTDRLRLGSFGESRYQLLGGYIFGQLPYLLLENHIGNESVFYTTGAYNTMNYFEFVSDKYASFRYEHFFMGMLFNKIPLIRKLKWRLLATANVLYGSLNEENKEIMSPTDPEGNPTPGFGYLNPRNPYIEVGYGIENIFKILRVDAVHRITYRDSPYATLFALKFSVQIKL